MNAREKRRRVAVNIFSALLCLAMLASCASAGATSTGPAATFAPAATEAAAPRLLRVMTHDSFAVSDSLMAEFEKQNNVKVEVLKSGDAGAALNKAILTKNNPLADIFYGVDNTFLSRALDEGIFEPYDSPLLKDIPDSFKLDPQDHALPVDFGDVCLNYDKAYFAEHKLQPPQSLEDLTKPAYKSQLVVENPATSSPGLAFLLVTIANYGQNGYLDYWKKLVANDVLVVNGWETAYYTDYSGSSGKGPRPIVVSYNSDPVFEMLQATTTLQEPPTAAITAPNTCFQQIEFVGILKGTQQRDLAEKWIDFMLSPAFQEDMPNQMYVFPVNKNAKLSEAFTKFMPIPQETAQVSPQEISQNREQWLNDWTAVVLR
jgi:thiamine transport system substrate-binding protein